MNYENNDTYQTEIDKRNNNRRIGIGIDDNRIFTENDIVNPEAFYPAITEKVIERLRGSPTGSMRTNEIRNDLSALHNLDDPGIQSRIIHNVINDPRTLASIRRSNPNNSVDYYVSYNRE